MSDWGNLPTMSPLPETSSLVSADSLPSESGKEPESVLSERSRLTRADNSTSESGNGPESPFALRSSPDTRPTESISTPCHSLRATSLSHPPELVQLPRPPPVASYNTRKTAASASEQFGPDTCDTESVHAEKRAVLGMHRPSLPLKSSTRSCDRVRKVDGTIPVSRLSLIQIPVSLVASASSAGTSPVNSFSPSPRNSRAPRLPSSGTMGPFRPLSDSLNQRTCPSLSATTPYHSAKAASVNQLSLRSQFDPSVAL